MTRRRSCYNARVRFARRGDMQSMAESPGAPCCVAASWARPISTHNCCNARLLWLVLTFEWVAVRTMTVCGGDPTKQSQAWYRFMFASTTVGGMMRDRVQHLHGRAVTVQTKCWRGPNDVHYQCGLRYYFVKPTGLNIIVAGCWTCPTGTNFGGLASMGVPAVVPQFGFGVSWVRSDEITPWCSRKPQ